MTSLFRAIVGGAIIAGGKPGTRWLNQYLASKVDLWTADTSGTSSRVVN